MKQKIVLYRIAKIFISIFIFFSAWYSWAHPADLQQLGFPDYFRIELVIAKCLGATLLLVPFTGKYVKEWIYAGFFICMISAMIAHICSHDPISKAIFVAIDFALVFVCVRFVRKQEYVQQTQG